MSPPPWWRHSNDDEVVLLYCRIMQSIKLSHSTSGMCVCVCGWICFALRNHAFGKFSMVICRCPWMSRWNVAEEITGNFNHPFFQNGIVDNRLAAIPNWAFPTAAYTKVLNCLELSHKSSIMLGSLRQCFCVYFLPSCRSIIIIFGAKFRELEKLLIEKQLFLNRVQNLNYLRTHAIRHVGLIKSIEIHQPIKFDARQGIHPHDDWGSGGDAAG